MKTILPKSSLWSAQARQTLLTHTIRGAHAVVIGYHQHPEILELSTHLRDSSVISSTPDVHRLPDHRAYAVVDHPEYRRLIVHQILETIRSLHPQAIIIHKEIHPSLHPNDQAA